MKRKGSCRILVVLRAACDLRARAPAGDTTTLRCDLWTDVIVRWLVREERERPLLLYEQDANMSEQVSIDKTHTALSHPTHDHASTYSQSHSHSHLTGTTNSLH